MFTRSLKLWHDRRRHATPTPAVPPPANDNRFDQRLANGSQRTLRPVLACRWSVQPATGRLECIWQSEPPSGTSAEAPGPYRHNPLAMRA